MSNVTRQINLSLDVTQMPVHLREVIDADTGAPLAFYRANSLVFSVVFKRGAADFDMSDVAKVSIEVKKPDGIGSPRPNFGLRMYKEAAGEFETGEPVGFEFDAYETAIQDGNNWLSVTLYSEAGEVMTTVSGVVNVLANGFGYGEAADVEDARDKAVKAAIQSCKCAARSEAAAGESVGASTTAVAAADRAEAAANGATGSSTEAVAAAAAAKASETAAQASRESASTSASAAAASETAAAASAATARGAATSASASQIAAAASATSAGQGATEAETARVAAVAARNEAETFRNQSSTSATSAGSDAAAALAAKQAAESANTTAVAAATTASAARDEAVPASIAAVNAGNVATSAAATATGAATTATTQANRSQTEANRAQSIAANLQAVGEALSYRGAHSAATAPTGAQRGYFWIITGAAAWGGIAWQVGDYALYNGTTWQRLGLQDLLTPLRQSVSATKQPVGGVHFEAVTDQSTRTTLPGLSTAGLPAQVSVVMSVTPETAGVLFGDIRGTTPINAQRPGTLGMVIMPDHRLRWRNERSTGDSLSLNCDTPEGFIQMGETISIAATLDTVTGAVSLYAGGALVASGMWDDPMLTSAENWRLAAGFYFENSLTGAIHAFGIYSKVLTTAEISYFAAHASKVAPLSARSSCIRHLNMDDGVGRQLRDVYGSSVGGLLSATNCTHLLPRREFEFVWTRVSSGFLGDADLPVLPAGAVIDSIIWEDAKATRTTASLGYNASNTATHVAAFTPAQARQHATLAAGSMTTADRRLYLNMSTAAGAVTLRVRGHVL